MKKILLLAVVMLAGAMFTTAFADNKKDKKKAPKTEQPAALVLATPSDSTSYAAGYAATQGLKEYLKERYHVEEAFLDDFVRGYREYMVNGTNEAFNAYAAGMDIAKQANTQILINMKKGLEQTRDSITAAMFNEGFIAGVKEDTTFFHRGEAEKTFDAARKAAEDAYKNANVAWLKDNATKPGVVTLPSGLQYKVLTTGTGAKPTADQTVKVAYEGKTIDGNVFDATYKHAQPGQKAPESDEFGCNRVIKGWTEALTNMTVGSKWEIYIPQELAYGSRAAGQIKPYSTLIFTVELKGIVEKPTETKPAAAETKTAAKGADVAKSTSTAKKRPTARRSAKGRRR